MRLRFLRLPISLVFLFALAGLASPTSGTTPSRELGFRDRVRAQEALERVRFSHQIGDTRPFQEAVPPSLLEEKVRTYLKQSVALERFWKTPVTSEMLRKELERMARQSQMPERLRELFSALGNDPVLIQDCLVRPVLVERLIHNFFDFDQRLHAASRREADSLRQRLALGTLDPASDYTGRVVREYSKDETGRRPGSPLDDADPVPGELLSLSSRIQSVDSGARSLRGVPTIPGEVGPVLEERDGFVFRILLNQDTKGMRVASYNIAKERFEEWWSEVEPGLNEALIQPASSALDPLPATEASALTTGGGCLFNDSWNNQSLGDPPSARSEHSAVWTGSLMLIWGGRNYPPAGGALNTGGRYDPDTGTWTRISTVGAPSPRYSHSAVWTGSRMVVWGPGSATGGIYDPVSDTWSPMSPAAVSGLVIWAGGRMVVWHPQADSGGRYDPVSDSWEGVSPSVTLANRTGVSVISIGNSMIAWGGRTVSGGPSHNTGARYDPATDTWTPLATPGAPSPRLNHTAVWSGSEMLIWGGSSDGNDILTSGGRYNPGTDTWQPISTASAPSVTGHRAEWAGGRMVIWKQTVVNVSPAIGARYDPATDSWASMSTVNAPSRFRDFTTVSTGNQMIVWGGVEYGLTGSIIYSNTGGRYDPATDTWTPTIAPLTPTGRIAHSAVWTGNVMVVWGGGNSETFLDTGGRYDPALDAWAPTSTSGAPLGRQSFTTLWTGSRMIVWGGNRFDGPTRTIFGSGGRYDPLADSWSPTTLAGAPTPRYSHRAVWTGSRMIVWGGYDGSARVNTGALYDPVNDSWTDTPTMDAPSARSSPSAVWTGSEMVVWGGNDGVNYLNTGGRLNPSNGIWDATSTIGAPSARIGHSALWTGSEMVVWGGYDAVNLLNTGGRFNPTSGIWNATSTVGAPSGRGANSAIWTGSEMVIWGGDESSLGFGVDTGGRYAPSSDSWQSTSMTNTPRTRWAHGAVWTGSAMLLWGGVDQVHAIESDYYVYLDTGGQYCLCPMSPYYRDADADGFGDAASPLAACATPPGYVNTAGDCNDSNAGLWGTPSEALDLSFIDGVTLAWSPPASPGANSVSYDLIRSGNPADFVSAASCTASDSPIASATDATTPALAGSFHYLVRAQNDCPGGVGPLGNASDGTPRTALDCP